ncbi:hypothetical protein BDQ17DRAFT_1405347 [Cyathus striatus]|nr:hypothetical protein BDQ17DRAFT_1405347 [Cyathus striatus]
MPAERTKGSQRGAQGGPMQIVMEPLASSGSFAFAPNVTPGTFNDPMPPLVDPPCESILFPPAEDGPVPRRPGHSRKKPENHIPRPPNAFILFRSSFIKSQHVSSEVETNHSTLSKIIGLTWQNLPTEERQIWHAKAKAALEEHKRRFPQYEFKPLHGRSKGGGGEKRKVREVGPKDSKRCAKIAELLVNGKKGQELDAAIQEFDKHHVPEVITRFEAPITASTFQRSSSLPAIDSEETKPMKKLRAASAQPIRHRRPGLSSSPTPSPEQVQGTVPEVLYNALSFDQHPIPSEVKPSFDFNAFSFNDIDPTLSTFPCDSLSQSLVTLDTSTFETSTSMSRTRQLSIDTSFLNAENWTRTSSPLSASTRSSPATPVYIDSPSPEVYSPYTLEATPSDYSVTKGFGEMHFQSYQGSCPMSFNGCDDFSAATSGFLPYEQQQSKAPMVQPGLDFSDFMASLPDFAFRSNIPIPPELNV